MSNNGMTAKLVWDGDDKVRIPEELGTPRDDQMQGTAGERLTELAGRTCYDSLGKGRPSFSVPEAEVEGYHDHIKKVKHGSVWEHYQFTVEIRLNESDQLQNLKEFFRIMAWTCANRPGVIVLPVGQPIACRVTLNLRSVVEWCNWSQMLYREASMDETGWFLAEAGHSLAPGIVPKPPEFMHSGFIKAQIVEPESDHEKWVSLFMSGSRGFSHELVRHGDFTAISQRSTRYVDESEGLWVIHPLITQFMREETAEGYLKSPQFACDNQIQKAAGEARVTYRTLVQHLEPWLVSKGVDKFSARKQARGAARGFLGNALQTEMIFSASVAQWKLMLRQRASEFADAEIRHIFVNEEDCVLNALKSSRYADSFKNFKLAPSPDGIGHVAVETT